MCEHDNILCAVWSRSMSLIKRWPVTVSVEAVEHVAYMVTSLFGVQCCHFVPVSLDLGTFHTPLLTFFQNATSNKSNDFLARNVLPTFLEVKFVSDCSLLWLLLLTVCGVCVFLCAFPLFLSKLNLIKILTI